MYGNFRKFNHITISGCVVRDAVIDGAFAVFRLAHNLVSGGKTIFLDCNLYFHGDKKPPMDILRRGSKVIVDGSFSFRRSREIIEVEKVVENEPEMRVRSDGSRYLALQRINRVELDAAFCSKPIIGKYGNVARFRLRHNLDQVNTIVRDGVMFPKEGERLPVSLLQEDCHIVVSGRLNLNTYRNTEGEQEIVVDSIRLDEREEQAVPAQARIAEQLPEAAGHTRALVQ